MKILNKYLLKEHVGPFFFAATALTSLMLLQYIARRFGDLVGKGLGWQVIAEFFVLSLPFTVAMTLPMGVLVAVLYAFSRLASENEITALKAGGVSMRRLLVPILWLGTVLALFMLGFNDQVLPRANHRLAVLQGDIVRTKPTFALREQIINSVKEGQLYLRASRIEQSSGRMNDIVIYDLSDPTRRRTIYADSGFLAFAQNQRDLELTLYHGYMQSVPSENPGQITRLFYLKDKMRVLNVASGEFVKSEGDTASRGDREMSICEMQRQYDRWNAQKARADFEVADAQYALDQARGRAKGRRPQAERPRRPLTAGALYCRLYNAVGNLSIVKKANAAQVRQSSDTTPPMPGRTLTPVPEGEAEIQGRLVSARSQSEESMLQRNRYAVEIEKKFSLAATCIIFVLIGAPIALRFPRGGVGLVLGVSFFIFALYYVGLIGGEALANKGLLSPFWAMWSTNVIFLVLGLIGVARMGTEATTARGGDFREMLIAIRAWFARGGRRVGLPLERRRA